MKQLSNNTNSILAFAILMAAAFSGCDSTAQKEYCSKDNPTQAKENVTQITDNFKNEIDNFKKETNLKISDNDKIIVNIKIKMETARKDVKATYEKQIAALEQKNSEMKKKWMNTKKTAKKIGNHLKQNLVMIWMS
ncbi:MAG TPA: hypothetical protein PKL85_00545 [Bacteroidia bacterium]|nr:hypothetical protein [Bacteroidia bacterium]